MAPVILLRSVSTWGYVMVNIKRQKANREQLELSSEISNQLR